jgi:hypothetical protein
MPESTRLLLYGAARAEARAAIEGALSAHTGVQGAPLTLVEEGPLVAPASPVDRSVLRSPDTDTVLAYRDVVEAGHEAAAVVPFRLGIQAATRDAAQSLVARHREALMDHLRRFDGRVEMGIRLERASVSTNADVPAAEAASGRAYLEARRDARARAGAALDKLVEMYQRAVGEACVDMTTEPRGDDAEVVSLAFLVPEPQADATRERLAGPAPEGVVATHIVGPWAPYSFVTL